MWEQANMPLREQLVRSVSSPHRDIKSCDSHAALQLAGPSELSPQLLT